MNYGYRYFIEQKLIDLKLDLFNESIEYLKQKYLLKGDKNLGNIDNSDKLVNKYDNN